MASSPGAKIIVSSKPEAMWFVRYEIKRGLLPRDFYRWCLSAEELDTLVKYVAARKGIVTNTVAYYLAAES